MKQMSESEFLAIADELTPHETSDKGITVYTQKTEDGIAFYNQYSYEKSYFYLFTLKENIVDSIAVQLYREKFMGEE